MRFLRLAIAIGCFLAVSAGVQAQGKDGPLLKADLWIDPRVMHLDDPIVEGLLDEMQFDRVILYSFVAGTTLVPTKNAIFSQIEYYKGKEAVIKKTVEKLHARKIKVYAGFDCFRWFDSKGPDVFKKHRDLVELGEDRGEFLIKDKFGSAFNPEARRALQELAGDFAENLTDFDGVLLCPQTGRHIGDLGDVLGFSPAAEKSLFDETGLELEEVSARLQNDKGEVVPKDPPAYRKWKDWRQEKVVSMLKMLKQVFETKMKKPGLAVLAFADYYALDLQRQNQSLEDSVEFVRRVGFDEVVLETTPNAPKSGVNYRRLRDRLTKEFPSVSITLLIGIPDGGRFDSAMESLVGQTADRVVVRLGGRLGDFEEFGWFKRRYDEGLNVILPRKDLRDLELDPRLQKIVIVAGNEDPSLQRQFEELKAQVGIPFGIKNAHAATRYGGGVGGHEAWVYMQLLAIRTDVKGRWEKTNDGYDFIITWPLAEPEKKGQIDGGQPAAPRNYGILWWFALVIVILATVAGVLVLLKRGRKV